MPRPTALPRLTVGSVLKMAHEQALRQSRMPPGSQIASPGTCKAIEQVWELVKGRLGQSPQAAQLDELIRGVTGRQ